MARCEAFCSLDCIKGPNDRIVNGVDCTREWYEQRGSTDPNQPFSVQCQAFVEPELPDQAGQIDVLPNLPV